MSANPARPPAGVDLCALGDLADPGAKGFRFRQGEALFAGFVVRQGEEVRGYVDSCPHAGWPLSALDDRYLTRDGRRLLCAGHGALFRPADGTCVAGPCAGEALTPWPVTVAAGRVVTATDDA
ncbi:Rieske (2Fe-2S) protein [Phenylobacterium sp.]|uniref:Rieske (2Fe-2S) protein n=1 Tax=Phenylobacterium sp. TaxID=1871053 RepID=UPI0035B188F2